MSAQLIVLECWWSVSAACASHVKAPETTGDDRKPQRADVILRPHFFHVLIRNFFLQ